MNGENPFTYTLYHFCSVGEAGESIHKLFPEDDTAHRLLRVRGKETVIAWNLSEMLNRGNHRISRPWYKDILM